MKLLPGNLGFCYLAGVAGLLRSPAEGWRVAIGPDNVWSIKTSGEAYGRAVVVTLD